MQKGDVKKASALMMIAVFAGFLIFFTVGYLTMPFQGVNYTEQRNYAPKPEFTFESFRDGSFGKGLESYISDHLLGREFLITLKHDLGTVFGKTFPNAVYKGKEGQFFLRFVEEDKEGMKKTLERYRDYASKKNIPVDMLLMPDAGLILKELMPTGAVNADQFAVAQQIIDTLSSEINVYYPYEKLMQLKEQGMKLYFKTDHHWTVDCVKEMLDWYMQQSGQEIVPVEYQKKELDDFYGSLYSGSPSFFSEPDKLEYLVNPHGEYSLSWLNSDKKSDSLFDSEYAMGIKNKYDFFLGGKSDLLRVESNAPNKRKILVIGDSYSYPFICLLADQYSEIEAINITTYERERESVDELIGGYSPDRIVFVNLISWISCGKLKNFR